MVDKSAPKYIQKGTASATIIDRMNPSVDRCEWNTPPLSITARRAKRGETLLISERDVAVVETCIRMGCRDSSSTITAEVDIDTGETGAIILI